MVAVNRATSKATKPEWLSIVDARHWRFSSETVDLSGELPKSLRLIKGWRQGLRKRGYEQEVESTARFSAEVVRLWEAGRAKTKAKTRTAIPRHRRLA